jgi:hypothetical protein
LTSVSPSSRTLLLVDDQLLLSLLLDRPPEELGAAVEGVFIEPICTTGYWYYRLSRAITDATRSGALSDPVAELPANAQLEIVELVRTLPPSIAIVPLRELAPVMAEVSIRHNKLNLLALEAIAAAIYLDAEIWVATDGPPMRETAAAEGVQYRVIDVPDT